LSSQAACSSLLTGLGAARVDEDAFDGGAGRGLSLRWKKREAARVSDISCTKV
jgi:hypothetical protein